MSVASPKLDRTIFTTSRLLEFCSEKELIAQTGTPVKDWVTKHASSSSVLSVYHGGQCLGHVLPRGRQRYEAFDIEAFDINDTSLGIYTTRALAIAAAAATTPAEAGTTGD
jgi:hypothetical protein